MISAMSLWAYFLEYVRREKGKGYEVGWIVGGEEVQAFGDCERGHQKVE